MKHLIPRWQQSTLHNALKTRRVLLLVGGRQCGKTTLVRDLIDFSTEYRTLDDTTLLEAARSDPRSFAQPTGKPMIIDEVQKAPELLPAIKQWVDENNQPGQFILTGSANIQALPNVQESLAGRVRKIRLRPLTMGERSLNSQPSKFLNRAYKGDFSYSEENFSKRDLLREAFRGGFPEVITLPKKERKQWHRDYLDALLDRDLKDIARVRRRGAMAELVTILAAWSTKYMDISAIGAGLSIRRPTVESYIHALEAMYIVERVPPWTKTDYARVGKQAKLIMTDSGMMAALLNWNEDQVFLDPDRSGKLTESFIFNELAAQADLGDYQLYHYRDRQKREIDILVERADGALLGVEVKAGSVVGKKDFKHLRWFQQNLAGDRIFKGIVLYTGDRAVSFGDDHWAVPIHTLWES